MLAALAGWCWLWEAVARVLGLPDPPFLALELRKLSISHYSSIDKARRDFALQLGELVGEDGDLLPLPRICTDSSRKSGNSNAPMTAAVMRTMNSQIMGDRYRLPARRQAAGVPLDSRGRQPPRSAAAAAADFVVANIGKESELGRMAGSGGS
ncbi:hypothetical protein HC776_02535 [bacterium]|nr:hypothetical protein [bacterium]